MSRIEGFTKFVIDLNILDSEIATPLSFEATNKLWFGGTGVWNYLYSYPTTYESEFKS